MLEMCDGIRCNWKPESLSFISKTLDQLENDYVKYHTYLAIGLHNAVQHKDADYRKFEIAQSFARYVEQIEPRRLGEQCLKDLPVVFGDFFYPSN